MKIQKKIRGWGRGGAVGWGWGQGGPKRRIKVFVQIKKIGVGGGVAVKEELQTL